MIHRFRFLPVLLIAASIFSCDGGSAIAADGWPWPVSGDVITPYKNGDDPYAAGQHRGIDIAAPLGTIVHSSVGGAVTYAGHLPDGGITVTVRSDDARYLVSYLHMSALSVVKGDELAAGAAVGAVGVTGKRSATQPHLHLGVRLVSSGAYVDPLPLLGPRAITQPPAADAPAVAQPQQNAAPQAKVEPKTNTQAKAHAKAHEKTQSRTRRAPAKPRELPQRTTAHAIEPQIVHAPATGDSVSARPSHTAADSARESHASKGAQPLNRRVAPPPFPAVKPQAVNLATPGRDQPTTKSAAKMAGSGQDGNRKWMAIFLAVAATIAAVAFRRRRRDDGRGAAPLADREDLIEADPEPADDVVQLRSLSRRAQ